MGEQNGSYPIGVVERDTGIGRDTLRVWERRYGFPRPGRNDKGERIYSEVELRRLQRIRRLLDQGLRPGRLLSLDEAALDRLEAERDPGAPVSPAVAALLEALDCVDAIELERLFRQHHREQGMRGFVVDTVAPLLNSVGQRWGNGRLQIFQEHFLTQQLTRFLGGEITRLQPDARKPLMILATLPGEEHALGLLMVSAMLASHGISTINLGPEVPMDQIEQAVHRFRADIVGITFSGAYSYKNIRPHLVELRELLPDRVDIWTGGEGVRPLRKLPEGVYKFTTLEKLPL